MKSTKEDLSLYGRINFSDHAWHYCDGYLAVIRALQQGVKAISAQSNIGKMGAVEIAKELMQNKTCEALFISDYQIGAGDANDTAAKAMAKALTVNSTLVYLCFQIGHINLSGIEALTEAMKVNSRIRSLHFQGCGITGAALPYFEDLFKVNFSILRMNFSMNNDWYSSVRPEKLNTYFRRNKKLMANLAGQHIDAFAEAMLHGEKAPWKRSKLMVIGQGRAGKTATVRSLLGESFDPVSESTVGISLTQTNVRGTDWKKEIVGKVDYQSKASANLVIQNMQVASNDEDDGMEVNENENEEITEGVAQFFDREPERAKYAEVANKVASAGEEVANKFFSSLVIFNDQTENGTKLEECIDFAIYDYGGQQVFYTLHHLFLTEYGLYLLVFDMREMLNNTKVALDYLRFWVNSVNLHASSAPVIMIGTFLDEINSSEDLQRISKIVGNLVKSFPQHVPNRKDGLSFFPLDNTGSERTATCIARIRKKIEMVSAKQDFVNMMTPMRWIQVLDELNKDASRSWYSLEKVRKICRSNGIQSTSEMSEMLALFHRLGVIVHLTATSALEDIVTVNPQWLIDCLSMIIRSADLHGFDMVEMENVGLKSDAESLFDHAIASRDLLEYLWRKSSHQVNFLIDLMRETLLISDWGFKNPGNEDCEETYLVPSMLHEMTISSQNDTPHMNGWTCKLDFSVSMLPTGVFQRFMCSCMNVCTKKIQNTNDRLPPKLYQSYGVIFLPEGCIAIEQKKADSVIELVFENENVVREYFIPFTSVFNYVNDRVMSGGLQWDLLLQTALEDHNSFVYNTKAKQNKLKPWFDTQDLSNEESEIVNMDMFLDGL